MALQSQDGFAGRRSGCEARLDGASAACGSSDARAVPSASYEAAAMSLRLAPVRPSSIISVTTTSGGAAGDRRDGALRTRRARRHAHRSRKVDVLSDSGVVLPGLALVISPLVSLMGDQVRSLLEAGVRGAFLNSTLKPGAQGVVMNRALAGAYDVMYVAPSGSRIRGSRSSPRGRRYP